MAADIGKILKNLFAFYDFSGKTIVSVGAGGGQFSEIARPAREVFAVDNSREALETLRAGLSGSDLKEKFTLVHSDFNDCRQKGDVVIFEFCLHEMPDPDAALTHALDLAGDVLVLDHMPESPWAYYVTEEIKAAGSWRAVRAHSLRKYQDYGAVQFFKDYEELRRKVEAMGEAAIARIEPFFGRTDIVIPMAYGFALI